MLTIKTTFGRAAAGTPGISTLTLLFFALAILDDADRREQRRRKKRERTAALSQRARPKPPSSPRPF